jgi:type VI secretion system secreted protein VgrG
MATAATQKDRRLAVYPKNHPVDKLLLTSFSGEERMSRLFSYTLEMISDDDAIDPLTVVGHKIAWSIKLADEKTERFFNGHVARFTAAGRHAGKRRYIAEVVPWLWFLTQKSDCRVFQELTVPEIVEEMFAGAGVEKYETSELSGSYLTLDYCVQYRETDFNFVSRLLENEGIFYYFRHTKEDHTLVLCDQAGAYKLCSEKEVEQEGASTSTARVDRILSWSRDVSFTPNAYRQTDYNFALSPARTTKTPADLLLTDEPSVAPNWNNRDRCNLFDYPGGYPDKGNGKPYTKIRMEEQETTSEVVSGTSMCKSFGVGGKFKLTKHEWPAEEGRTWAITAIRHDANEPASYTTGEGGTFDYQNSFRCIPESVVFRPERITPKPLVHGTQTAVVTGPQGEEIWPDKYGRVKVQFFWDRYGERTERSSCWIRCAQSIAGKNWGAMFIPRVGQEVVVSYLEGDPDRPLITGGVYNDDQMPPYPLPDEKTKSVIKTNSTTGGDGFNEIRFEDRRDEEQIFIHAQRNLDTRVRNDSMERVVGSRHLIVGAEKDGEKTGDQIELVHGDKFISVLGDQGERIEGQCDLTIGHGENSNGGIFNLRIEKSRYEEIGEDTHLIVGGNRLDQVKGGVSVTCGDHQQKSDKTFKVEAKQDIHLKAGTKVVLEATQISLKCGGNFIDIGPAGVSIVGTMVLINSGGAAAFVIPAQPQEPEMPAPRVMEEPTEADNAKTGKKSAPDSLN